MYLEVENIEKYYGDKKVLDNVSITIDKPMIYGLLGPNGAGKTTLLNIITGVINPDKGTVLIKGLKPSSEEARRLIGYCPQEPALYKNLSGLDNILFYSRLYGLSDREAMRRAKELLEFLNLTSYAKVKVGKYSGGMMKKLSLAIALIHDPEILILDEPTTGMDPNVRRSVWDLLIKLRREGKAILLATHYMEEADYLSDIVGIFNSGKLLVEDTPDNLKKKYGPPAVIVVELAMIPPKDFVEDLRREYGLVYIDENYLRIHVSDPDTRVPRFVDTLYRNGLKMKSLKITKPSLEDVFIKLTGRRID